MRPLWHYRRFIWDTAVADLHHRYAGSGLGVFWNVLTPLAMLALYSFIFAFLLAPRLPPGNASAGNFVLYLASGFLPWGVFADGLMRATNGFVANAAYLRKMPIPEQVFVAQSAVSGMLSMFIILVLLVAAALVFGEPPAWTWWLLPVVGVFWQGLAFGLGLTLATLNVFFRDVAQIMGVLLQIWMWSLPVIYVEELLPQLYRGLAAFNPAYPFLRAIRDLYLNETVSDPWIWASMLGWVGIATVLGLMVMSAARSEVRDLL